MNEKLLTPNLVRTWVDAYRNIHGGAFPHANAGAIANTSENWSALNRAMSNCYRGWTERMTLRAWLDQEYPESKPGKKLKDLKLTPAILRSWVDNYRIAHDGKFPTASSGKIGNEPVSWQSLSVLMTKGGWGWTKMHSLATWLDLNYPDERILNAEILRKWVDNYRATHHGKFPTSTSGIIDGTKTTWSAVNSRMATGIHHLPANISLTAWIDDTYSDERFGSDKFLKELPRIKIMEKSIFLNIIYRNVEDEISLRSNLTLISAKLNNFTFHYIDVTVDYAIQTITQSIMQLLKIKKLNGRPSILTIIVSKFRDGVIIDWSKEENIVIHKQVAP